MFYILWPNYSPSLVHPKSQQFHRFVTMVWECNYYNFEYRVELNWCCDRRSVGLSVFVSGTPLGPMTRFSFFPLFCWTIALLFVMGRPLSREDGSVICSVICQWSESQKTHNRTLLSHMRLLGSLSVASYDSQGLRRKYSSPPPHGYSEYCRLSYILYTSQEAHYVSATNPTD
jgi:hypothetical protein